MEQQLKLQFDKPEKTDKKRVLLYDYRRDKNLIPGEAIIVYADGTTERTKENSLYVFNDISELPQPRLKKSSGRADIELPKGYAGIIIDYDNGYAWGNTASGRLVCLGSTENVKNAIRHSNMKCDDIEINQIIQLERELIKREVENEPELQRPGTFRSRTAGKIKRGTSHVKPASFRKRLPGSKVKC